MTAATILGVSMLALAALPSVLIVWNLGIIGRRRPVARTAPARVSVLIPARNEAANIRAALGSVLANRGVEVEVLVLDDHSTDATAALAREASVRDPRVGLIEGRELPDGLCGKPHACMQLAAQATGDVLLFMDADVRLGPNAIRVIADELAASGAAMISGLPRQQTVTLGEKLIVPLMHYVLFGYLPMHYMRRSAHASLGAACGQVCALDRAAYESVGGHGAIATHVHDGIALARQLRTRGYHTDLMDMNPHASCRMYRSWREVVDGFAKNAHEGLGSPRGLVPWTVLLLGGQSLPLVALVAAPAAPALAVWAAAALALGLFGRALLALRFGQSWLGALLHPVGVAALVGIQWYALARRLRGRPLRWKDRAVAKPFGRTA